MSKYPKEIDGNLVWACCLSVADCNHKRVQRGLQPFNLEKEEE